MFFSALPWMKRQIQRADVRHEEEAEEVEEAEPRYGCWNSFGGCLPKDFEDRAGMGMARTRVIFTVVVF